ncbi:hypothetical protein Tco_0922925 [Tanacetum coccineum]|uniref:Uncharacterized protein n=1 Tax=Tanacetum coccineum TaxID=301880 RepID=A0ABQ5D2U5_9ASTR
MPAHSATQYWQPDTSSQPGSYYSFGQVPFHMGRQNLQTTIETHDDVDGIFYQNILNRGRREQFPSKYKLTPFMEQPPTTTLPKERVNKTKNKGTKANLSPLNLGGAFEDDNVEENIVVRRGNYINLLAFLNDPHQVYLDCYMKGYIVPVSFWHQLVPQICMPDMHRLPHDTPIGWLSGEHMNSWMELLIRRRAADAKWTVAYTSTINRGCINETRPPHNFQYSYNDGLGIDVPQQTKPSQTCGVSHVGYPYCLCAEIKPVVRGTVPDRSFRVTFKSPRAFGEQDLMIATTCSSFLFKKVVDVSKIQYTVPPMHSQCGLGMETSELCQSAFGICKGETGPWHAAIALQFGKDSL